MLRVVKKPKLYEQVVEQIKALIIQGVYKKGELLPSEKELMEMAGVSRITVREALRILNEAGVIETHKGKGSFVIVEKEDLVWDNQSMKSYTEQFLNSTNARILLEPAIAREVASAATEEELAAIEKKIRRDDLEDGAFHRAIIAAVHNPVLLHWFDELTDMESEPYIRGLVPPARQKNMSVKIAEQHQKICSALKARNGEFAYFYMKEHLIFIRDVYEEYFEVFYD